MQSNYKYSILYVYNYVLIYIYVIIHNIIYLGLTGYSKFQYDYFFPNHFIFLLFLNIKDLKIFESLQIILLLWVLLAVGSLKLFN